MIQHASFSKIERYINLKMNEIHFGRAIIIIIILECNLFFFLWCQKNKKDKPCEIFQNISISQKKKKLLRTMSF